MSAGAFINGALLRDFIFSRDTTNGGAQHHSVGARAGRLLSFHRLVIRQQQSRQPRFGLECERQPRVSNYAFNGAVLPTNNVQYSFSFITAADEDGQVLIGGRHNPATVDAAGAASFGVFFNGMQIETATTSPPLPRKRSAAENQSPIE